VRVYILGVNHQIQSPQIMSYSTSGEVQRFEHGQKDEFRTLLCQIIRDRCVLLVGEEARHDQSSIAAEVCAEARIAYMNIEMLPEQRRARGIMPGYERDANLTPEQKAQFHREREQDMYERMLAAVENENVTILVICGSDHAEPLAGRFRASGYHVEVGDLTEHNWYIEDWTTHMMRL